MTPSFQECSALKGAGGTYPESAATRENPPPALRLLPYTAFFTTLLPEPEISDHEQIFYKVRNRKNRVDSFYPGQSVLCCDGGFYHTPGDAICQRHETARHDARRLQF